MFYQTKVKSIFPGGIIDAHNKRLVFAGNKLARVGDLVWTDGSVVFGHTPIRGGGAFFDSSIAGVPVIGNSFEGYFDLNGNFHSANLPVSSSRFVNDDKYYYAVPDNALDAEISVDNNGNPDGFRYAISTNGNRTVFKNGQKENTNFQDTLNKYDDVGIPFFFLDKNDIKIYFYHYQIISESEYYNGESYLSSLIKYPLCLYENNNVIETPAWYIKRSYGFNSGFPAYLVSDGGNFLMSLTIQDNFKLEFQVNSKALTPDEHNPTTFTITVDVYDNNDNIVISQLPLTDTYPINYPFGSRANLKLQRCFLSGFAGYGYDGKPFIYTLKYAVVAPSIISVIKLKKCCLIRTVYNELWKYSETGGLTLIGTGLKNFRLRKMKNVLHAKVIS